MSFTLATSAAIQRKAGRFVNSTLKTSGAALKQFADEADGIVCAATNKDWITDYSNVTANKRPALAEAVSCLAAISMITWDTSGYTNLAEAQTIIDVLDDKATRAIAILKDNTNPTFAS